MFWRKKKKRNILKVAQKPKGSLSELRNEQLNWEEEVNPLQLDDTSCPTSHCKYPWLLGCLLQSRHCSTPVKILWVILNCLVEKVNYTNLISLVEESGTSHTHKVVSLPIQSKLHFALVCLNSLKEWGWGQCKTYSKILTSVLLSLEKRFCQNTTEI